MRYVEIKLGKSVQALDPFGGEFWVNVNPLISIGENENEEQAVAEAFVFVDKMINAQLPEKRTIISETKTIEKKTTIEDLKKEMNVTTK